MTTKSPTIYEALKIKLGREPTIEEIIADCERIIGRPKFESIIEKAERLKQQRYERGLADGHKHAAELKANSQLSSTYVPTITTHSADYCRGWLEAMNAITQHRDPLKQTYGSATSSHPEGLPVVAIDEKTCEETILKWCRANPKHGNPCMRNLSSGKRAVIAVAYMDPKRSLIAEGNDWFEVLQTLKSLYPSEI